MKSDSPIRPGGCSWRKITSRSAPFTARQPGCGARGSVASIAQVWIEAAEFLQHGNRSQSGRGLQHWDDFIVPDIGEGIGSASFSTRLLFPGKPKILFER